jgi:hypothetical protein
MTIDLAVGGLVKQLRRAGYRPSERQVQQIVRAGAAAVEPLIALALEIDLFYEEPPECFAPLHALRLLGELKPLAMIAPLLGAFPLEYDYFGDELQERWEAEVPEMIGRIGAAAVEPLWAIADDQDWPMLGRGTALAALAYATVADPALYDAIIAGLNERLARSDDKEFNGHLVSALANLAVSESYKDVMALYRAGRVDQSVIPASRARQFLLTKSEQRLRCVLHPLRERYDKHGPFPREREV